MVPIHQVMVSELRDLGQWGCGRTYPGLRTHRVTLTALTPTETKVMNGMQALQMVDPSDIEAAVETYWGGV